MDQFDYMKRKKKKKCAHREIKSGNKNQKILVMLLNVKDWLSQYIKNSHKAVGMLPSNRKVGERIWVQFKENEIHMQRCCVLPPGAVQADTARDCSHLSACWLTGSRVWEKLRFLGVSCQVTPQRVSGVDAVINSLKTTICRCIFQLWGWLLIFPHLLLTFKSREWRENIQILQKNENSVFPRPIPAEVEVGRQLEHAGGSWRLPGSAFELGTLPSLSQGGWPPALGSS